MGTYLLCEGDHEGGCMGQAFIGRDRGNYLWAWDDVPTRTPLVFPAERGEGAQPRNRREYGNH